MLFELDHYYAHPCGRVIHVIGELPSTVHGWCLVAEQSDSPNFIQVGRGTEATVEWQEVGPAEWQAARLAAKPELPGGARVPTPEHAPAPAQAPKAHGGYVSANEVEFLHPADFSPEHGAKMLLYMFPYGVTVVGQWQGSGASLWAPLPKVGPEMYARLDRELELRRRLRLGAGLPR